MKSLTATTICTIQCTATFLFTLLLAKTMFELLFISDMIKQRWKDRMTFMNAMRLLMSSPSLIQTFIILLDTIKMHWQCSSIYCNTLKLDMFVAHQNETYAERKKSNFLFEIFVILVHQTHIFRIYVQFLLVSSYVVFRSFKMMSCVVIQLAQDTSLKWKNNY